MSTISHLLTFVFGSGALGSISKLVTKTGGGEQNLTESLPVANNQQVAFACDVSQLKSLYMVSAVDMTVKTNSSGAPANTFTLTANVPFVWLSEWGALRDTAGTLVNTDITTLYVTNAAATAGDFILKTLTDPTL